MEDVGIGTLRPFGKYLRPFGIFCGNLVNFPLFKYVVPRNTWQHWSDCGK
jgi:hypothetical protein